jgi:hypothetical protein
MGRELKLKTNVNSPNSEYPYGQIRDDNGTLTHGTPVNELLYGDIHQFMSRMFEMAKAVDSTFDYNDEPDNAYDGFQYFEAFQKAMFGTKQTPSYTGTYVTSATSPIAFRKVGDRKIIIQGATANSASANVVANDPIFTLPSGYRPAQKQLFSAIDEVNGTIVIVQVLSTGVVSLRGDLTAASNVGTFINLSFYTD